MTTPTPADDRLWGRWVRRVTAGELVGFAAPATVGVVSASWPSWWAYPAMLAAGAVEGAVLGWAQAGLLRPAVEGLRPRRFIALTSAGAVVAYAVGLAPSTLGGDLADLPPVLLAVAALLAGAVLLGSIGTAQWIELRRWVPRAGRWVAATALAWALALAVFGAVATPLWHEGQPVALSILVGLVAGLCMAATAAAVTGAAFIRLVRQSPRTG